MRPTAAPSIRRNHVRRDSESVTPEPPDNRNATADNGGESQNIKASDLLLSSLPPEADLWRDQLTRIERILDNILRTLGPMVGAR